MKDSKKKIILASLTALGSISPDLIARAWRDPQFFQELPAEIQAQIPQSPAGEIQTNWYLDNPDQLALNTASVDCNTSSINCNTMGSECNTMSSNCNTMSSSCNTMSSSCNTMSNSCNTTSNSCNTGGSNCNTSSSCNTRTSICNTDRCDAFEA